MLESKGLVRSVILIRVMKDWIQDADCGARFILRGFPRTLEQAKATDALLGQMSTKVTKVVEFSVPDEVLTERICGRWVHKDSGRSYHVKFRPLLPTQRFGALPSAQKRAGTWNSTKLSNMNLCHGFASWS